MQHLHGKKGKALVHVAAVDAPVTIDAINACILECLAIKQTELHVSGVDWDFQNDTFMNGWVAYRTRKERKLTLKSDVNGYAKPGKYAVMVKVVDIFGNDTSQAFEVEVK